MNDSNASNRRIRIGEFVHIRPRGKRGIYVAEFHRNGRHHRLSLKTTRRAAAEREARALEVSLAAGTYSAVPAPVAISTAIEQFIDSKRVDGRSGKTLVKYQAELKTFAEFAATAGATKLHQITAALHDRYRGHRLQTLHAYTVYNHAITVKGFIKWCESRELLRLDPLRKVKLSKPARPNKWSPPLAVVNQLLSSAGQAVDPKLERMIATLAFTGMRSGELVNLRPKDVDLDGNWIHIAVRADWQTKTGTSRKVPIHSRLQPYLVDALKAAFRKPYLFCDEARRKLPDADRRYRTDKLLKRMQALAEKLGIAVGHENEGFVVHSLRHFFQTFCVNSKTPQRAVDVWLGHVGDRSTSGLYYQLSDADSQALMRQVPFNAPVAQPQHKGTIHVT